MCGRIFFFQAEDGIRDLVRSRGLGDVYKRQVSNTTNDLKNTVVTSILPVGVSWKAEVLPQSEKILSLIHI